MQTLDLCRMEAARRRVAFLGLEGDTLRLEVREPSRFLVKALQAKGFQAEAEGEFTLRVSASNWETFWAQAGPLFDCGC